MYHQEPLYAFFNFASNVLLMFFYFFTQCLFASIFFSNQILADFMTYLYVPVYSVLHTLSILFLCSVCIEMQLYILIHIYKDVQFFCLRASDLMKL